MKSGAARPKDHNQIMVMPILKRCFSQRRKGRKGENVEQPPWAVLGGTGRWPVPLFPLLSQGYTSAKMILKSQSI
jgi:hypothetical protein